MWWDGAAYDDDGLPRLPSFVVEYDCNRHAHCRPLRWINPPDHVANAREWYALWHAAPSDLAGGLAEALSDHQPIRACCALR